MVDNTNYIIMKSREERTAEPQEKLKKDLILTKNILKATEADKEKLELDLNAEIATLSNNLAKKTFKKQRDKKEAERLAVELGNTQTSLKEANDKATNEKTELLKQLKEINQNLLKDPLAPNDDDLQKQLDAIKGRLAYILETERKDTITIIEQRQAYYLNELKNKDLILNDEEKKTLDFIAGYYYWHSNGDPDRAKDDIKALKQFFLDNKDKIKSAAIIFSAQCAEEHLKSEEEHHDEKHQFLKDLADLNNKYSELDKKYKDRDAELLDATEKLKTSEEEKEKLSDEAEERLEKAREAAKRLNDNLKAEKERAEKDKTQLLSRIDDLKEKLKQKEINEKEFISKLGDIQDQLNETNAKLSDPINKAELYKFAKNTWKGLENIKAKLDKYAKDKPMETKIKNLQENYNKWLDNYENEFNIILEWMGMDERERERETNPFN